MTDVDTPAEQSHGQIIDPFAFMPTLASRILGLGGNLASADPTYGFHTPYVACAPGHVHFTLRFKNLKAAIGNLTIRINAMSSAPGASARTVKLISKSLRDLSHSDGETTIEIKTKGDTIYAILGLVYGPCDASAEDFKIVLDRPNDGSLFSARLQAAKYSVFGVGTTNDSAHLVSPEKATLAYPVSQMCTAAQFDEPDYQRWLDVMKVGHHKHRKQWEFVYILQALDCYGVLQPGAKGVGFGVGGEPLPAVFASRGCEIVATDLPGDDGRAQDWSATGQHIAEAISLRRPEICSNEIVDKAISFRPVDMTDIPRDLREFDFCWSACALEHLGSINKGLRFITESLRCLKVGGIAVHTTEFNLSSNKGTVDRGGTVIFRRSDIERLALDLVSLGHEVAQIKYDQGSTLLDQHIDLPPYQSDPHLKLALGRYVTTSFGLIVRKGELA